MALVISMILMIYCEPYVAKVDQHVAMVSLLSLAGVAHISSIFKSGTSWDPMYIILAALLFLLPIMAYIFSKFGHLRHLYARAHAMADYADIHSRRGVERSLGRLEHQLRSELSQLSVELLKRRARSLGVSKSAINDLDDLKEMDTIKAAAIELVLMREIPLLSRLLKEKAIVSTSPSPPRNKKRIKRVKISAAYQKSLDVRSQTMRASTPVR